MTTNPQNLRWPAEWEPHAGTAMTWPHNAQTWHRGLDAPRRALTHAVRALARHETVHLHFHSEALLHDTLTELDCAGVVGHVVPNNDAWCRDHGALIARTSLGERIAIDFGYNAWGGKYPPWDDDARVAQAMADYLELPAQTVPWVLEGGAIEGNGQGVIMTTASCVLNPNRNPSLTKGEFAQRLGDLLGTRAVLWLGGEIAGDDTDGHIDNLARFVGPAHALVVAPENPVDDAQRALTKNVSLLETQAQAIDMPLRIDVLPLPQSFIGQSGLPASYANFYIGARCVLMPVFADPADDDACATVESCFPDRELVPVDGRDLIVGLGALHCLTQPIPSGV
ncbi:MAG: agmatine/peptidylarginine deiminase [Gammaproteobacteria bacterium]